MKTSEQIEKLAEALSKAQGQMENPEKNRKATIKGETKTGKPFEYSYNYADLPATIDAARKALSENGLSHFATLHENGEDVIMTMRLMHSSGQWIESGLSLTGSDDKTLAASQTFCRRYLFMALTGIAGDEDTDGPMEGQYRDRKPLTPQIKPNPPPLSPKTTTLKEDIAAHATRYKWKFDDVKLFMIGGFGVDSVDKLTQEQVVDLKKVISGRPFDVAIKDLRMSQTKKPIVEENPDSEPAWDDGLQT